MPGKNFYSDSLGCKIMGKYLITKMKLTDGDGDGHVTLPEYEQSIIRALKKQGVRIYED